MKLKPIVAYPGGKRRFAKEIISKFPESYNTYYEPFIGMGAVFLELQPKKAVISDINPDIINVWKQVRDSPIDLLKMLKAIKKVNKEVYSKIGKKIGKKGKYDTKRAVNMLIYMKYSYRTLPKFTKDGNIILDYFL